MTVAVSRRVPLALVLIVAAACSGESAAPNPPPPPPVAVVATVEITPSSVALTAGDTTRLGATVRDQQGAAMAGKTPTWSSSNPTVATVSATGLVTATTAGQAVITAAVDGKQGTAAVTVSPAVRVALDSAASRSTLVDRGGDTLTATAANGLVYVLELPAHAVDTAVRVTMTPVRAIQRLPLSGGLVGAVELAPAGLRFNGPVTLRIKASPTVPTGQKVVGLEYAAGGEVLVAAPAQRRAGEIVLTLTGIGLGTGASAGGAAAASQATGAAAGGGVGVGAGLGTAEDIGTLPIPPASPAALIARVHLAALTYPADETAILTILRGAYFRAVRDAARLAVTAADLRTALHDWLTWVGTIVDLDNASGDLHRALRPEDEVLFTELVAGFQRIRPAIDAACVDQRDAIAGFNLLTLHGYLREHDNFGVLDSLGLTRSAMLASSCVQVFPVQVRFPDPAVPGVAGQLEVQFGLKFGTDPTLVNTVFAIALTVTGSTSDGPRSNNTDAVGRLTTAVTATGLGSLTITGTACIPTATNADADDLCAPIAVTRSFGRLVTGNLIINSQAGLLASADVMKVTGQLTISNVTSTELAELGSLEEVGGQLLLTGNPALRSLRGLRGIRRIGSLQIQGNPALVDLDGLIPVESVQLLSLSDNHALASIAGLAGIDQVDSLVLRSNPLVTSLRALRGTAIREVLVVGAMNGLTTLEDLTGVASRVRHIGVSGNEHLSDLGGLRGVSIVTEGLSVSDNALTSLNDLGALSSVRGGVHIRERGLTSFALNGLTDVDAIGFSIDDSPLALSISLGSLRTANSVSVVGSARCTSPGQRNVSLSSLATVVSLSIGGSADHPACSMLVTASGLTTAQALSLNGRGLTSVLLGSGLVAPGSPPLGTVSVDNTSLTSLALRGLDVHSVSITGNPLLATFVITGILRGSLTVTDNPELSTFAIREQVREVTIGGSFTVRGNKEP